MFSRRSFLQVTGLGSLLSWLGWKAEAPAQAEERPSQGIFSSVPSRDELESHYVAKGVLLFPDPTQVEMVGSRPPSLQGGLLFDNFGLLVRRYKDGRPQTSGMVGRLIGPTAIVSAFYARYGDLTKSRTNTLILGLFSQDEGSPETVDAWVPVLGVVLTKITSSIETDGMVVAEGVEFLALGSPVLLKRDESGMLVYTCDDPRWNCVEGSEP